MIQERVKSGLERAKAQGKTLGRPATAADKVEAIKAGLGRGEPGSSSWRASTAWAWGRSSGSRPR